MCFQGAVCVCRAGLCAGLRAGRARADVGWTAGAVCDGEYATLVAHTFRSPGDRETVCFFLQPRPLFSFFFFKCKISPTSSTTSPSLHHPFLFPIRSTRPLASSESPTQSPWNPSPHPTGHPSSPHAPSQTHPPSTHPPSPSPPSTSSPASQRAHTHGLSQTPTPSSASTTLRAPSRAGGDQRSSAAPSPQVQAAERRRRRTQRASPQKSSKAPVPSQRQRSARCSQRPSRSVSSPSPPPLLTPSLALLHPRGRDHRLHPSARQHHSLVHLLSPRTLHPPRTCTLRHWLAQRLRPHRRSLVGSTHVCLPLH